MKSPTLEIPGTSWIFTIVVTAYIPIVFTSNGVNLQGIRALRVLRPLRTISNVEALRVIVVTLLAAFKPLLETLFVLFFLFLIFSIAGLQLFGGLLKKRCFSLEEGIVLADLTESTSNGEKYCSDDSNCGLVNGVVYICGKMASNPNYGFTNFDTIFMALLMVFQTVTLEGWSDIMYALDKTFSPFSSIFFIALIVIGSFFLLNLTLAVIKAEFTSQSRVADPTHAKKELTHKEKLQEKITHHKGDIFKLVKKRRNNEIIFNKYEIKKESVVALDAEKVRKYAAHARRRLMKDTLASRVFDKLGKAKNIILKTIPLKAAAAKGLKALGSLIQRFKTIEGTQPDSSRQTPEKRSKFPIRCNIFKL